MRGIILGAGFTGMAAAIKTGYQIYESSNAAGGICNSYTKEGFQFFNGGPHLLFGQGIGLDYIKTLVPVNTYARKSGIYFNKIFPYPFQTMAEGEYSTTEGSLKDWLKNKFGKQSCNMFFNPFNDKYTAGLYDEVIQYDEYKSPPAGSQGFSSTYCDPVKGLSHLVNKMSEQCSIEYGMQVVGIDVDNKKIKFQYAPGAHKIISYDKLISTIPLGQLLWMCGKRDIELPYTSVLVINIGAEAGINLPHEHWLYVPYCKTKFHRIGFYTNIDPTRGPEGKVGLAVEMAFLPDFDYPFDFDIPFIIDQVVQELQSWGFIGKVITADPTYVRCAYTWLRKKEDRQIALDWLKERDIISTGRYGKWHFQGMIDSIKDGFECEE